MIDGRVDFCAPEVVRAALVEVGRTEDVAVSPDGSRLALAAFTRNRIYVFSLAIDRRADALDIRVAGYVALSCDSFAQPHGCTFLDKDHLLVCNRGGDVIVVPVPEPEMVGREVHVDPQLTISGSGYLNAVVKTPGSVAAYSLGDDYYRAFICSDQWHFITSHVVALGRSAGIVNEGIRIEKCLQIPDGIACSPDLQWIAVSNHVQGQVQLFRNSAGLDRHTSPEAVLGGSVCPHGLTFDADGNLYVADAASPYVHRYDNPPSGWGGPHMPSRSFRLLDNETFYMGRYAAREGGIKGIHVERRTNVLVTTHKLGTLEFHDLQTLQTQSSEVDMAQLEALRLERDDEITRSKTQVLKRKWNLPCRLREELDGVARLVMVNARAVLPLLGRLQLENVNRRCRESLLDPTGPVVSMTSHSTRIFSAHLAIESIARGDLKPKRLLLWLSDEEAGNVLPDTLRRLQDRGLEVSYTTDLGPHTKYFPYVASEAGLTDLLVTADDDLIYARDWLAALAHANQRDPRYLYCHRARRMRLNPYHFEPYGSWEPAASIEPHPLNFAIGASGVAYPSEFQRVLQDYGTAFLRSCPTADDIWLNRVAHREGFLVAQVAPEWPHYSEIPASQLINLYSVNIGEGGNQLQLADTYSPEERANLFQFVSA